MTVKNKYFILITLLLVFLLLRLPILLTSINKVYDFNELYIGTIAKELIEGPTLPIFDYQLTHIRGGTLLAGIITVPFFLLLGQSYFTLKLVALLFSLLIITITYLFLWRFFNRRIAVITALLMVAAPPLYTIFSSSLYGRDYESILFTMIVLSLFYRAFFDEASVSGAEKVKQMKGPVYTHKDTYLALLGLVSGIGMYFDYIFAVTLVMCFLFWFIFDRIFFARKSFWLFFGFFIAGLSPWIYYNLTHNFAAICIDDNYPGIPLKDLFFLNSLPEVGHKLKVLLLYILPDSFYFRDFRAVPGYVLSYAYYFIFLISFCVLFWLNRKTVWKLMGGIIPLRRRRLLPGPFYREAFILLYPICFSLLYSFSYYIISRKSEYNFFGFYEYTYLIILYPFIFIIIAIFLNKLWDWSRAGKRIAGCMAAVILFFLIVSGSGAAYELITPRKSGNIPVYEGYSYDILGIVIGERYGRSVREAVKAAERIRRPYRASVFRGIGWNIGWRFFRGKSYRDVDECLSQINKIDESYRPYVLEGFGAFLELQLKDTTLIGSFVNKLDQDYRPYVYRGVGWFIGWRFKDRFAQSIRKISTFDEQYQPDCYRGLGEITAAVFGGDINRRNELISYADHKYRKYVLDGFNANPGSGLWSH